MKRKSWFTLIELMIVIVIIGIMLAMIPFRMQSLRNHTQLSLISQQREDIRNRTLLLMRQWRAYDTAQITLTTTWVIVVYSGGMKWAYTEQEIFPEPIIIAPNTWNQWNLKSYDVSCTSTNPKNTAVEMTLVWMHVCYQLDEASCTMKRLPCVQLHKLKLDTLNNLNGNLTWVMNNNTLHLVWN